MAIFQWNKNPDFPSSTKTIQNGTKTEKTSLLKKTPLSTASRQVIPTKPKPPVPPKKNILSYQLEDAMRNRKIVEDAIQNKKTMIDNTLKLLDNELLNHLKPIGRGNSKTSDNISELRNNLHADIKNATYESLQILNQLIVQYKDMIETAKNAKNPAKKFSKNKKGFAIKQTKNKKGLKKNKKLPKIIARAAAQQAQKLYTLDNPTHQSAKKLKRFKRRIINFITNINQKKKQIRPTPVRGVPVFAKTSPMSKEKTPRTLHWTLGNKKRKGNAEQEIKKRLQQKLTRPQGPMK